jgi:hypothetical protein
MSTWCRQQRKKPPSRPGSIKPGRAAKQQQQSEQQKQQPATQPVVGQSLLSFKFDRKQIMKHLTFAA